MAQEEKKGFSKEMEAGMNVQLRHLPTRKREIEHNLPDVFSMYVLHGCLHCERQKEISKSTSRGNTKEITVGISASRYRPGCSKGR